MGEAAYEQAKAEGSLIQQRLRECVRVGGIPKGIGIDALGEAADIIDWLNKERDSLIIEIAVSVAELERYRKWFDDHATVLATHRIGGFRFESTET